MPSRKTLPRSSEDRHGENDREEEMDFQINVALHDEQISTSGSIVEIHSSIEIARSVQGSNQRSIETMKKLMVAYVVFEREAREF